MIERFVIALRALSGSADEQLARFAGFVAKPGEILAALSAATIPSPRTPA